MSKQQLNNPLHGKTLEHIVNSLVEHYGWNGLGKRIKIRCFTNDPSVKSSLKFLRKTAWAREQVEELYITIQKKTHPDDSPSTPHPIYGNFRRKSQK